jgi:hypothetical protein
MVLPVPPPRHRHRLPLRLYRLQVCIDLFRCAYSCSSSKNACFCVRVGVAVVSVAKKPLSRGWQKARLLVKSLIQSLRAIGRLKKLMMATKKLEKRAQNVASKLMTSVYVFLTDEAVPDLSSSLSVSLRDHRDRAVMRCLALRLYAKSIQVAPAPFRDLAVASMATAVRVMSLASWLVLLSECSRTCENTHVHGCKSVGWMKY